MSYHGARELSNTPGGNIFIANPMKKLIYFQLKLLIQLHKAFSQLNNK